MPLLRWQSRHWQSLMKTGASSIYGSDAIAGVVNIKTREELDGFDMRGFTSVPQQGGGETYNVSGAWGKVFDGGHITLAGDYWHQNALKAGDRKYLSCQEEYLFRPDGKTGTAVLAYPNVRVILGWNRSQYFAAAVGLLADRIAAPAP